MFFTMNRYKKYFVVCVSFCFFSYNVFGYELPGINLGFTNILDGGPVRPYPGVYWLQYSQYYHAHKFTNSEGTLLGAVPSPYVNVWTTICQFVYQLDKKLFFEGMPGISVTLPIVLYSRVQHNNLGFSDSGSGLGNLNFGIYSQWGAVMYKDRPLFIHRLEFDVNFPSGKNREPKKTVNPSSNFFFCGPHWAGTIFATPRLALSWRMYYLWNAKNKKTQVKAGDAYFCNYSLEYELFPNFYMAFVGYYLQQLSNNRACGVTVPNSRERVFGVGPGAAYFCSPELIFFGYLYKEVGARNRPEGISFILRFVKHF